MRCGLLMALVSPVLAGCASGPDYLIANPLEVPRQDYGVLWERAVNIIDDYFQIAEENQIDGRIETLPKVGATLLEPWSKDSVNLDERFEATLQTTRRKAIVQITPSQNGFSVDVQVVKELEDVPHPQYANAGDATFGYDTTMKRHQEIVTDQVPSEGWIALGRDFALEQELLRRLQAALMDDLVFTN